MHLQLTTSVQTLKRWQHPLSPREQITSGNYCHASDPSRLPKQVDSGLQHISSIFDALDLQRLG